MKNPADFASKVYGLLLWLYPAAFRNQFREQMLLDFSDMANDAKRQGSFSFLRFWIRELYHLPAGLLQAHWKHGLAGKALRSQPVNYGVRNAFVFGLSYGLSAILSVWTFDVLLMSDHPILDLWSVFYFVEVDVIYWIPSILSSLLAGLTFGTAFTITIADRSNQIKYTLITMICWFLSQEALGILRNTNLSFYLGIRYSSILLQLSSILSALFLGLIFYLPNPENRIRLRFLAVALIGYPITTYLYLRILHRFSIIEGRTMFPALFLLLLLYIASVFAIAFKSRSSKKVPWALILFTIGYLLFPGIVHNSSFSIIPTLPLPDITGTSYGSAEHWSFMSRMSVNNAIYGMIFGLVVGVMFGLASQRKERLAGT